MNMSIIRVNIGIIESVFLQHRFRMSSGFIALEINDYKQYHAVN